jgi:hypothetical protein
VGSARSTLTIVMRFSSQAVRDMVVATGMETGAAESYDNLTALVAGLARALGVAMNRIAHEAAPAIAALADRQARARGIAPAPVGST